MGRPYDKAAPRAAVGRHWHRPLPGRGPAGARWLPRHRPTQSSRTQPAGRPVRDAAVFLGGAGTPSRWLAGKPKRAGTGPGPEVILGFQGQGLMIATGDGAVGSCPVMVVP